MSGSNTKIEDQEYKGAGKIGNAWAKATALAPVAFFVSGVAAAPNLLKSFKAQDFEEQISHINKAGIWSSAALLVTTAIGAIWGWRQSSKAQEQHKDLQVAVKDLRIENEKLASEKKWADRMNERKEESVAITR